MKRTLLSTMALTAALGASSAEAALLYKEGFVPTTTTGDQPLNDSLVGWSAYRDNGTDISGLGANPARITPDAAAPDGDGHRVFLASGVSNMQMALISDAPTILSTQRDGALTFSFQHRDSVQTGSTGAGFRVLAEVSGTWYVSDLFAPNNTSSWVTESVTVQTANWFAFETDLTDGFDLTNISGTAAPLAAGNISGFGILVIDGTVAINESLRLDDVQINGTVPEPGSLALLALGGMAVARRRRS